MTNILEIDVASHATAVGHSAASRLKDLLDDGNPNTWFCDEGFGAGVDPEAAVQALGAYVVARRGSGAEQLFIKAGELGLHRFPPHTFASMNEGLKAAYAVFVLCVHGSAIAIMAAQDRARRMEEQLRAAALQQQPAAAEDTIMEQHADVHTREVGAAALEQPAEGAVAPGSPSGAVAEGAVAAPSAAPAPAEPAVPAEPAEPPVPPEPNVKAEPPAPDTASQDRPRRRR